VRFILLPLLLAVPVTAAAQNVTAAVGSITPADVARRINIIAHDSMGGRDTPSSGLDKTAAYVASEFRRFGLKPGGDSGTFVQRYSIIRRQVDTAATRLELGGPRPSALRLGADFFAVAMLPEHPVSGPLIVFAGRPDSANPLQGQAVSGAWVVVLATVGQGRGGLTTDFPTIEAALAGGAGGVIMISNRSDADWNSRVARSLRPGIAVAGQDPARLGPVLELRDAAAASALGLDPAALRGATARTARRLEGVTLSFHGRYTVLSRVMAPNTVGILEGSDPQLKNEYVVYSAHMDHVGTAGQSPGCSPRGADSISMSVVKPYL